MSMGSDGAEVLQLAARVLQILEDLGAPAWIGGSLASSMYGIPRSTQDADIVTDLRAEMIQPFVERLGADFYADSERIAEGVERRSSFNLIYLPNMFKVDVFLLGRDPRSLRELERRRTVEIGEAGVRIHVTSAEDILVRKLDWYRDGGSVSDRQWQDALGVARVQGDRLDLDYLREAAGELEVTDLLDELLAEAGTHLQDFATRYAAAWSSQDPQGLARFYAENGSLRVNDGEPAVGRAAVEETARAFMTGFPDMVVRLAELRREGDFVEFHWHWTGTNTGPGGTGAAVDLRGFERWTLDSAGLILQSDGHFDEAEYQRQLGAGPEDGAAGP